jgi:hypothetical protein
MNGDGTAPPKRIGRIFAEAAAGGAEFRSGSRRLGAMARRASLCLD